MPQWLKRRVVEKVGFVWGNGWACLVLSFECLVLSCGWVGHGFVNRLSGSRIKYGSYATRGKAYLILSFECLVLTPIRV